MSDVSLDDIITLLPALAQFVAYLITYPVSILFNSASGLFTMQFNCISSIFVAVVNTGIDIFNLFAWLPVPVRTVFVICMGLAVTLLICRVIGRIIQIFYPSGAGD